MRTCSWPDSLSSCRHAHPPPGSQAVWLPATHPAASLPSLLAALSSRQRLCAAASTAGTHVTCVAAWPTHTAAPAQSQSTPGWSLHLSKNTTSRSCRHAQGYAAVTNKHSNPPPTNQLQLQMAGELTTTLPSVPCHCSAPSPGLLLCAPLLPAWHWT